MKITEHIAIVRNFLTDLNNHRRGGEWKHPQGVDDHLWAAMETLAEIEQNLAGLRDDEIAEAIKNVEREIENISNCLRTNERTCAQYVRIMDLKTLIRAATQTRPDIIPTGKRKEALEWFNRVLCCDEPENCNDTDLAAIKTIREALSAQGVEEVSVEAFAKRLRSYVLDENDADIVASLLFNEYKSGLKITEPKAREG